MRLKYTHKYQTKILNEPPNEINTKWKANKTEQCVRIWRFIANDNFIIFASSHFLHHFFVISIAFFYCSSFVTFHTSLYLFQYKMAYEFCKQTKNRRQTRNRIHTSTDEKERGRDDDAQLPIHHCTTNININQGIIGTWIAHGCS